MEMDYRKSMSQSPDISRSDSQNHSEEQFLSGSAKIAEASMYLRKRSNKHWQSLSPKRCVQVHLAVILSIQTITELEI